MGWNPRKTFDEIAGGGGGGSVGGVGNVGKKPKKYKPSDILPQPSNGWGFGTEVPFTGASAGDIMKGYAGGMASPLGPYVGGGVGAFNGAQGKGQPSWNDPFDTMGDQGNKAHEETKAAFKEQQGKIDQLMKDRPDYKGIRYENGQLGEQYKVNHLDSNQGEFDRRQRDAKQVKANGKLDVDGISMSKDQKDLKAGSDFKKASAAFGKNYDRAFGTGPSEWAKSRMGQADLQAADARDASSKNSANTLAAARSSLASQGGLSRGSAERLAKGSSRDQMFANQNVARQNSLDKLGITSEDEAQRLQLQRDMPAMGTSLDAYNTSFADKNRAADLDMQKYNSGLDMAQQRYNIDTDLDTQKYNSGMEMDKLGMWGQMAGQESGWDRQADMYNSGLAVGDQGNQNAYDQDAWKTQMGVQGNMATAQAIAGAPTGGGIWGSLFGKDQLFGNGGFGG